MRTFGVAECLMLLGALMVGTGMAGSFFGCLAAEPHNQYPSWYPLTGWLVRAGLVSLALGMVAMIWRHTRSGRP